MRSQAGKGNIEALARRERYRFLSEIAFQRNLDKIAIAHTQDDQAETVLMWLLRGAGRRGLGGMAPVQAINLAGSESSKGVTIIRPLLDVTKEALLRYLEERRLEYRLDKSNEDTAYLRNWIRFVLLPRLKDRIDPGVPSRLAQLAEVLRDEDMFLNALGRKPLEASLSSAGLRRDGFLGQPKAVQRRMLRLWIERVRGDLRRIDCAHIEALGRLICDGPPQSRLAIPGGWELVREYEMLRLAKGDGIAKPAQYSYPMILDSVLAVPEAGMTIDCRQRPGPPVELPNDHWAAVFDRAALKGPLVVRNFRHGDRIQPLGMAGHKKVKELFIEKRVPSAARALWPLLVMGREVLWLPGYGRSDIGRIGPATKEVLDIRVVNGRQRRL
jgi:tRNA(Ile)-lysidine synthase